MTTPPWIGDDDRTTPLQEPPPRTTRVTCTEAERAYLNAILDVSPMSHAELVKLRTRIAAERLDQVKRVALVRAWADSIHARERFNSLLEGIDLGGHNAPLYDEIQREAEALAESERNK